MADQKFLATTVERYYGNWNPCKNHDVYGIEVELEGVPRGDEAPFVAGWRVVADGSLRDGVEYVSGGPRTIDQVRDDFDRMKEVFEQEDFTPVFSFRTSTHVHCNVRDLTIQQIINMYVLYLIIEQPMLLFGGEERIGNVHCIPAYMAQGQMNILRSAINPTSNQATPAENWRRLTARDYRYASFNFASVPQHGTVEFRSHRGTMDKDTMMTWIDIIQNLKISAKRFDDPRQIVTEFSAKGIHQFIIDIFGLGAFGKFLMNHEQTLWEGLRRAQFLAFATRDWAKPKKEKKIEETMVEKPAYRFEVEEAVAVAQAGIRDVEMRVQRPVQMNDLQWANIEVAHDPIRGPVFRNRAPR